MEKKHKTPEEFCHSILQLEIGKSKALANLVMGLASQTFARSVTEVSLSDCYYYQYSSISDAINALFEGSGYTKEELEGERLEVEKKLLSIKQDYFAKPFDKFWLLNTDSSSLIRPHSPTLPDRSHVHVANNRVKGNRPVDIGYEYSLVGLSARRPLYIGVEPAWNLPLSIRRIPIDAVRNTHAAKQVNDLLDNASLPLYKSLTLNASDRQYCTPEYIADTYRQKDLINVIRTKNNRVVWKRLTETQRQERRTTNADARGADAVYGQKYSLHQADEWLLKPDETNQFGVQLSNGRHAVASIEIWEDMMIRTKRKKNMKNKPFRLVCVRLLDAESGEPIFKRRMWLGVWGQRRKEITGEEIYWSYRNRFDLEHFLRFGKQRLLLDKFQTPDPEHMDNWTEVVSLSYWLLWAAKAEAQAQVSKWQKYDENFKNRVKYDLPVSPSEVQRQLQRIILSFEQEPFIPKLKIKSKGRQKGDTQAKRERYKVVRKGKTRKKKRA